MYGEVKSVEGNSEDTIHGSVEEQENNRRLGKIPKWLADYETSFISIHNQPTLYQEVMKSEDKEKWKEAMEKALTLKENQTWTEVTSECSSYKIITSKWGFKIKGGLQGAKQYKA
ncbi:hypothetical protein HHI36_016701 [Cryptolaemus montrouzieri]|uniref:Uncharacterized protein n=1 Tax=Cryptolaemus montrouzieri TaxID=559131 RepID=A0ABD2NKG5_9CUCU